MAMYLDFFVLISRKLLKLIMSVCAILALRFLSHFASGMEVVDVNLPLIQQLFDYHIIINCSGQVNHVPASPEDQSVIRQHLFFPLLLIKVLQLSTSLKLFLTLGSCG